jgi:hypothetical protein
VTERRDVSILGPDLRSAMALVAGEYLRFLRGGPEPATGDDTKSFASHHAACRAALAHLEHLIKLARAMGSTGAEVEEAAVVLVEAREAIAAFKEEDLDGEEEQC